MEIKKLNDIKSSIEEFELKKLFSTGIIDFMHLCIKPSEVIDRQVHPFKSVFYVISGKGIIEAGTERKVVEKDVIIEVEANKEVGWINALEEDLKLLLLKLKA